MKIRLSYIFVRTKRTAEKIPLSEAVTFLYGPIGKGKSSVARLIDYCFGGNLERTPAIQQEFVAVTLGAKFGKYDCTFERGAKDTSSVRVTWSSEGDSGSVNAPLSANENEPQLIEAEVYNLSDLLFYLCGVKPIKVLKSRRDPDSKIIRLSFRDIWWYCYLDQAYLDSSFFRLEDSFKSRKSQDAMRFFTGLHSERLNQLQKELSRTINDQQVARKAVNQLRHFMARFDLDSDLEVANKVDEAEKELKIAEQKKKALEKERATTIHPTDSLRDKLRFLSKQVSDLKDVVLTSQTMLHEQEALKAEFITTKIKSARAEHADQILAGVEYVKCPECSSDISERPDIQDYCRLCGTDTVNQDQQANMEFEAMRRELNNRIDQISDSIGRRKNALAKSKRQLRLVEKEKSLLDKQLQGELKRYDSAFIENIRLIEREMATFKERLNSLRLFRKMTQDITQQEESAGKLQGPIDKLRSQIKEEINRLKSADKNALEIAKKFKEIMIRVGFPGVIDTDEVILDSRTWKPLVIHAGQEWGFWDTGSGGKKTLFNVCYALAVHEAAKEKGMPVPNILIIDSPTKNISDDENPELVKSLYEEIYRLAINDKEGDATQFLLIDSDLVKPKAELPDFSDRRMAGEPGAPSLIPYYEGP